MMYAPLLWLGGSGVALVFKINIRILLVNEIHEFYLCPK
jgi:hypothetical protein